MNLKTLTANEVFNQLSKFKHTGSYKLMYSSVFGGLVNDPSLMLLPMDDHMVHRGDGVFEAIRFNRAKIYLLTEHLQRLQKSADFIGLKLPMPLAEISEICHEMQKFVYREATNHFKLNQNSSAEQSGSVGWASDARSIPLAANSEGVLRLYVSRGPGDFSPNPYSTIGSQLYIVATEFKPLPSLKYEQGVSLGLSEVPVKMGFYAQAKTCNYLPNVMMKKESVDNGFDFVVAVNEHGHVAEGSTENILIFSRGVLVAPKFDYTLRGTTLLRALELAQRHLEISHQIKDITVQDLLAANEIMMVGTTLAVLPVTQFNRRPVGSDGAGVFGQSAAISRVGPVSKKLLQLITSDINS